jgi:hypothetical protein
MSLSREEIALWVIVVQGFAIMFFEWGVWWMKYQDMKDRRKWREAKRAAVVKKLETPVSLVPLLPEEKVIQTGIFDPVATIEPSYQEICPPRIKEK